MLQNSTGQAFCQCLLQSNFCFHNVISPPPSLLPKPLLSSSLSHSCFSRRSNRVKKSSVCTFHWSPESEVKWQDEGQRASEGQSKRPEAACHPGLGLLVIAPLSETLAETGVLTAFIVTIKNINGPRIQKANESFLKMHSQDGGPTLYDASLIPTAHQPRQEQRAVES